MDPITAGVLMMFGTGMNMYGQYKQGKAAEKAGKYNAEIDAWNAQLALQEGEIAAAAQQRQAKQTMGSMVANYGASGVQTDQGSPVDVLVDSARQAMLDNLTIKWDAQMKAQQYMMRAKLDEMGGQNAGTAGVLSAIGTGLYGFGNAYSTAYGPKR